MNPYSSHFVGFFSRHRNTCLAVLLVLSVMMSAGCIEALLHQENVVVPHIIPVSNAPAPATPTYTFPFEHSTITFTVPVNGPVYAGAKAADKEVTIYGNVSRRDWITQTYLSMTTDPNQEEFCQDLITQFRGIRQRSALDDDEYVELISVFVQSIHYETIAENPVKFPVETFTDQSGDCDDKSLLLAGLLSREGYRVALLSFPDESHMATGIVCPGTDYKNTGYAYIETTNFSLLGIPPDGLEGGITLNSDPIVIAVGNGTKTYGACDQTLFLHETYLTTGTRFSELSVQADSLKKDMQSLRSTGNIKTYNFQVPMYNALVGRITQNAAVHNYILDHQYDRKGTFTWVGEHVAGL